MSSENGKFYDPEEEMNYMPSYWSHRHDKDKVIENFIETTSKLSEEATKTLYHRVNIKCEDLNGKGMDIFGEDLPNDSPIFAFIHGGYWLEGSKELYRYIAKPLRTKGIITALIGYNLAPSATIIDILEEIKQTLLCLVQIAAERKSRGIYLSGHSVGAHLLAMLLSTEWMNEPLMKKYIKGVIFISGIYNIKPLLKTSLFGIVKDVIEKANPSNFMKEIASSIKGTNMKVLVVVAEYDSPKFIEQSQNYHQRLLEFEVCSSYLFVKSEDHYSIMEKLYDESFILTQKILNLIYEEEK